MSQRSASNPRNTKKSETVTGTSKRSVARAKPASAAGSTVRKASKSAKAPVEMTREERKAARKAERAERAEILEVADVLLQRNETYHKRRLIWGVCISVGFAAALGSIILLYTPGVRDTVNTMSIIAVVLLVISYACIIGGLIFDMVKVGPLRTEAEKQVKSMSARRRQQVLETAAQAEKAKKAAMASAAEEAKASKKGAKGDEKDGKGQKPEADEKAEVGDEG